MAKALRQSEDQEQEIRPMDFFDVIDGKKEPHKLVWDPTAEINLDQCDAIFTLDGPSLSTAATVKRMVSLLQLIKFRYHQKRPISSNCHKQTYERHLRNLPGHFESTIQDHLQRTGDRLARVFDFGCGYGIALDQILHMPFVDAGRSVGLTLPPAGYRHLPVDRIAFADAINLTPRKSDISIIRFNVLLSVTGVITYHPFNQDSSTNSNSKFGILHAINFLEVGGLLLMNENEAEAASELVELGIIKPASHLKKHFWDQEKVRTAYVVVRRPTSEDIRKLLNISQEGQYSISNQQRNRRVFL